MIKSPKNFKDLTGLKFHRLTVMFRSESKFKHRTRWACKCDCGKQTEVDGCHLKNGHTKSCGCFAAENTGNINRTHGLTSSKEYQIWNKIKWRCDPKNICHETRNYSQRGIMCCERWMKFENFLDDMGLKPSPHHTVERINNDDGYSPENCRWATRKEQGNNRRGNRVITWNGMSKTLQQWAEFTGFKRERIANRLNKGWPPERALTESKNAKT